MISNFDFSQSINDTVTSNVWNNRLNVEVIDGQLTSTKLGVLGTCDLTGVQQIEMLITPEASEQPSMSGVLMLGTNFSFRIVWSPSQEELVMCYCPPMEHTHETEELEPTEEGGDGPEDHSVSLSHPLQPGTQYKVQVTLSEDTATLLVDDQHVGEIPFSGSYCNVQVFASCGTKLSTLTLR